MEASLVRLRSGLRLCIRDEGQGPAVVMLHGLGGNKDSWLLNVPAISGKARCITVDLPGHGESDAPSRFYAVGDYADDILDLLDVLGVDGATVVGTSFGAVVGLEVAARAPGRVRSLVLMAPPGLHRETLDRAIGVLLRWIRDDGLPRLRDLDEALLISPRMTEDLMLIANMNLACARTFLPALPAMAAWDGPSRAALVTCPTLIVWGDADRIMPVDQAEGWKRIMPAARLVVLEGAGHAAPFDAADAVNALLASVL